MKCIYVLLSVLLMSMWSSVGLPAGQHVLSSRVPADQLEEARALTSPLSSSKEHIEKGKAIYEGKGTCVNCHGKAGFGDGPGGKNLNPPPRVFRSHRFWHHRSEGEIFWVIKHGSPGTAMIPFGGLLTDLEIWAVIQYERSFAGRRGRGPGRRQHEGMRPGERHHGTRPHGMRKRMEEKHPPEGRQCCQESEDLE